MWVQSIQLLVMVEAVGVGSAAAQIGPSDSIATENAASLLAPRTPQWVLGEHATGGEEVVVAAALGVGGLIVYDFVTVPRSVGRYNATVPLGSEKSAGTGLLLSVLATGAPLATGLMGEQYALVAVAGLVIGPSAGHFYAEQSRQAWLGLVLRAALAGTGLIFYGCCT